MYLETGCEYGGEMEVMGDGGSDESGWHPDGS